MDVKERQSNNWHDVFSNKIYLYDVQISTSLHLVASTGPQNTEIDHPKVTVLTAKTIIIKCKQII